MVAADLGVSTLHVLPETQLRWPGQPLFEPFPDGDRRSGVDGDLAGSMLVAKSSDLACGLALGSAAHVLADPLSFHVPPEVNGAAPGPVSYLVDRAVAVASPGGCHGQR